MNPWPLSTRALLVILFLAAVPYFLSLGASSLWDSNEAFYAETPRVMIETGDFISPSFNDNPRFNKPPLSYWVVAAFYKLFGVSEAAERLAIALGAIALIATAFVIGKTVYSLEAGLYAAIALAASPRFLMFSRRIIIDVYLALFMSLTLMFFLLAEKYPHRRRTYLALMYASVGLGVMTKGPVAAALPALAFLIYLAAIKNLSRIRAMMLPVGALIIVLIVLPWYVVVYQKHGWGYIESFIIRDNFSRFTDPVWGPRRGVFFYIPVMLGDLFPWSIFLIAALWLVIKQRFKPSSDESRPQGALLGIWVAVVVVFFSLSRNKEDLYILPSYAAASAIIGGLLARPSERKFLVRTATAAIAALVLITGAAVIYLFNHSAARFHLAGASAIGWAATAGGLTAIALILFKKDFAATAATALAVIVANYFFVLVTLPDFEKFKPARQVCEIIKSRAADDAMAGYYRLASPSMAFYLRRPVFEYYDEEDVIAAFSSGKEVYCLMREEDYDRVKDALPESYILATCPLFQVKLRGIFEKKELPQAVLVSNRESSDKR
ncbi:MAG TPA: glycosyltransferase family 39 protein [Blastocatellia bacterium]|jgi:4-amino-4-deoxy-L-arabinose transferase-like glycosyltransferase